jgi:hypothetical protein
MDNRPGLPPETARIADGRCTINTANKEGKDQSFSKLRSVDRDYDEIKV